MTDLRKVLIYVYLLSAAAILCRGQVVETKPQKWYKGNTHTHTNNSDGDSSPDKVATWYKKNGYNFLFITDHEFISPVDTMNQQLSKIGEFEVFSGQEITDRLDKKPYHVNGLGLVSLVLPQKGKTVVENLQQNIDQIRAAGGVPQINHPNFGWALTAEDIRKTKNVMLMEIYNGHPLVNNLGGGNSPNVETIWDTILTSGKLIYGIADDDSHYFDRLGDRSAPTPGHGWIMVRADDLNMKSILSAIERGDFYASTGVTLSDISLSSNSISITIHEEKWSKYSIQFIGKHGRILKTAFSNPAKYKFRGNEGYVRAKIIESNGKMAWIQPVMLVKK